MNRFGIELETEYVYRQDIYNKLPDMFLTTSDASIETPAKRSYILKTSELFINGDPIGVEIVSRPIYFDDLSDFIESFRKVTAILRTLGEKEKSKRAGIHIHIETPYPYDVAFLKNLLKLGLCIEPIVYAIGGFGYQNHAETNNFTYARSLSSPPIVYYLDRWVHLYEIERLFSVKTMSGFFKYMGVDVSNARRYHPARYLWLNFYSIIAHGTVEFRPFNKTFNSNFVKAAIELCRSIVIAASQKTINCSRINSVFNQYSTKELLENFENLNDNFLNLNKETKEVIEYLIRIHKPNQEKKQCVKTHLRSYSLVYPRDYIPPECDDAVDPNYVDVHTIRNGGRR